jgi:hypothetical protein
VVQNFSADPVRIIYGPTKQEITEGWKKLMRSFVISYLHQSSIRVIKSRRMKRADEKFMHFRRTASKKKHLTELGRGDRIEKCILQKNECVDLIYLVRIRTCDGRGYEQLDFLRDGELWD